VPIALHQLQNRCKWELQTGANASISTSEIGCRVSYVRVRWNKMFLMDHLDVCIDIGYSEHLRLEYQVSDCLASLDIRSVHLGSISRRRPARQKMRRPDVEGLA
jgi:hypothetical protein